jgi:hypothetical protein
LRNDTFGFFLDRLMDLQHLAITRLMLQSLRMDTSQSDVRRALDNLPDLNWNLFFHYADGHGVTPLIAERWRMLGVLEHLPDAERLRVLKAYRDNAERNQIIRDEVREYWRVIGQAGIEVILLKGWVLVEMLYESPALRQIVDMDMLACDVDQARHGLQALEAIGLQPLPRNRDAWVEKHLPAYWRLDGLTITYPLTNQFDPLHPRPVELHVRLWEENFRGLALRELPGFWTRSRVVEVAGLPVRVLSLEDMLVHLCVHWSCHWIEREARLNQLVDLDRFMRRYGEHMDWSLIVELGKASGVDRFVFAALEVAQRLFGTPQPPADVWQSLQAACPVALRKWIARHAPQDVPLMDYREPDNGVAYVLTWLGTRSLREKLGVMRYAALPPREFIRERYHLPYRWMALPFYAPYVAERTLSYIAPFARAAYRAR